MILNRIKLIGLTLLIILSPSFIISSWDLAQAQFKEKPAQAKKAPLFHKNQIWLQGHLSGKKAFKNKVTLVYFLEYATVNCIRELALIENLKERYGQLGLQVVFIHAPEFKFAYERHNVKEAVKRLGIKDPVLLDNDAELWEAYDNRSWPTKHLVNSSGEIVYSLVGEGNNIEFESQIRDQIKLLNPKAFLPEREVFSEQDRFNVWECGEMSTEVYVGYKRANWWGVEISNEKVGDPDVMTLYADDGRRMERGVFLSGNWVNREEYFEHGSGDGYLGIIYLGTDVYAVMDHPVDGVRSRVYIYRDDEPLPEKYRGRDIQVDESGGTFIDVGAPRLYYVISGEDQQYHELKLQVQDARTQIYLFSFSNRCLSEFDHR